jgi:hypothetical protein
MNSDGRRIYEAPAVSMIVLRLETPLMQGSVTMDGTANAGDYAENENLTGTTTDAIDTNGDGTGFLGW